MAQQTDHIGDTNKMVTAVEWFYRELKSLHDACYDTNEAVDIIYDQAKQMEKEQIMDAHIEGQRVFDKHPHTHWTNDQAEQYYNETYGGQGSPDTTTSLNTQNK